MHWIICPKRALCITYCSNKGFTQPNTTLSQQSAQRKCTSHKSTRPTQLTQPMSFTCTQLNSTQLCSDLWIIETVFPKLSEQHFMLSSFQIKEEASLKLFHAKTTVKLYKFSLCKFVIKTTFLTGLSSLL